MRSLFESLLRLYEFDGPATSADKAKTADRRLELGEKDASTFPYLP